MKLQFLVPQWKENEDIIKNLLNSIELQQGIDFNDIGVIIINDGSDTILSDSFLKKYPFKIDYYLSEHKGVSAIRNECLKRAEADYVMFCDADDMFISNCGIYIIFLYLKQKDYDVLISTFSEEIKTEDGMNYINHENDATFVHGKVYRRKYLIENNIFWDENLTIHEDSYFNYLSRSCTFDDKIANCHDVFYLWKYRPDSICRKDKKYILKTYSKMIDSTDNLANQLIRRKMLDKASIICSNFIYQAYYEVNKNEWNDPENKKYYDNFMKRFAKFYFKYEKVAALISDEQKKEILSRIKTEKINQGVFFEKFTFDEWVKTFSLYIR